MLFKIPPLLEVWSATVCLQVPAPFCLGLWVGSGDLCVQMGFPKKTNLSRLFLGQYSGSGNGMEPSSPILVEPWCLLWMLFLLGIMGMLASSVK